MHIIGWMLFGLVVGLIAKLLMPGRDPGGIFVTMLLGIGGSLIGGYIGHALIGPGTANETGAGWIGSILGTILLLILYRVFAGWRARHV